MTNGITGLTGENPDGSTYLFPNVPGETGEQIAAKKKTGYVELPNFAAGPNMYCCGSCEYFKDDNASPTGYVCQKYSYFDKPMGCCGGWELIPELRGQHYQDANRMTTRS